MGYLMAFGVSQTGVQFLFDFLAVWSWISTAQYLEHIIGSVCVGRCYYYSFAKQSVPVVFSVSCIPDSWLSFANVGNNSLSGLE